MPVLSSVNSSLSAVLPAAADSEGLSLGGILSSLPHDPATIFVFVLLVAAGIGLLRVSRGERPGGPGPEA